MCHFIICGLSSKITTRPPANPATDIFCPHCSNIVDAVEVHKRTYCTFFFIPICPVNTSFMYVGCFVCKGKFADTRVRWCNKCRNVILDGYRYCGRCGETVVY